MDVKEIDILGPDIASHWYYLSKAKAMTRLIDFNSQSIILDVGAGSGYFSRYLLEHTDTRQAWCIDINYELESNKHEFNKQIYYRRSVDVINADLVLVMDVIEHLDDDILLLKEYINKVSSGTRFFISVPAFQFLWSGHDEFLGHKRRYTLKQLEEVIRKSGLIVERSCYYFGIIFFPVLVFRMAKKLLSRKTHPHSDLTMHNPIVNKLLRILCSIELPLMKFNHFVGLSVFCVARKP